MIGVAGVILFSLRDAVSASEVAAVKRASIAGDRTHPLVYRAFTALSVVLQFGCMYLCGHWARSHGLLYRGRIPWLVLFTVAVLATAVLHECGHALIAWGFHMKLLGFNAGPMQWKKREGRWKFKFVPAGFINLGGAVRVVPTDAKQPRMHDLWMIAAGPLSNIFFGSIALYLLLCVHWPYYEQTWRLVAYTASFCYIAGITNLLPFMTEDGNYSDGARILQILTKSPLEVYHRTMDSLASTLVTERRYRDLDIEAIQRAAGQFPQELRGLFPATLRIELLPGQRTHRRGALCAGLRRGDLQQQFHRSTRTAAYPLRHWARVSEPQRRGRTRLVGADGGQEV